MTDTAISGSGNPACASRAGTPTASMQEKSHPKKAATKKTAIDWRLHKHADYQQVYRTGRRQSLPLLTYFFAVRAEPVLAEATCPNERLQPRIGLTTGRVLGKAVERNRIKRRMRAAVRRNLGLLTVPVDVVLHPRRSVLDAEFAMIEREVARAFEAVQRAVTRTDPQAEMGSHAISTGK